jgi:hypothetical protein
MSLRLHRGAAHLPLGTQPLNNPRCKTFVPMPDNKLSVASSYTNFWLSLSRRENQLFHAPVPTLTLRYGPGVLAAAP